MKLIIYTTALVNAIQPFQTLSLDGIKTTVSKNDHIHCDQSTIPNELENGMITEDLECEILNQHTVCSTTCQNAKRVEFECNCNRQFMSIVFFDINSCYWKTITDAPCPDEYSNPSTQMLYDVSLHEDNSTPMLETIEPNTDDDYKIYSERIEADLEINYDDGIEYKPQTENETESHVDDSTKLYNSKSISTERHIPTCTTLDKPWNCSNANLIRYIC